MDQLRARPPSQGPVRLSAAAAGIGPGFVARLRRPGLDLWQILVLGVVRLGLDCDYDRLEDLANHHTLLRQILGLSAVPTADEKPFHYKTLSDNVCHLDEELLAQINAIVAQAGRAVFKKKDEPIRAKTDSYVLETNVHFPTDVNLLWDAPPSANVWT